MSFFLSATRDFRGCFLNNLILADFQNLFGVLFSQFFLYVQVLYTKMFSGKNSRGWQKPFFDIWPGYETVINSLQKKNYKIVKIFSNCRNYNLIFLFFIFLKKWLCHPLEYVLSFRTSYCMLKLLQWLSHKTPYKIGKKRLFWRPFWNPRWPPVVENQFFFLFQLSFLIPFWWYQIYTGLAFFKKFHFLTPMSPLNSFHRYFHARAMITFF